jgi:O-antigen/teichoic acid export membrane protein
MASLAKKVTSEIFVTTTLHGVSLALNLLFTAILSRLLTPGDYGTVAAALLFLALCDLMREVGIGATIIQLPDLSEIEQRTAVTLMWIVSVAIFAMAQLAASPYAGFMRNPAVENALRVLAFVILIQSISTISQGLLLREIKVRQVMVAELGARLLSYGFVGVGMALAGLGFWALVGASLSEALFCMLILLSFARPLLRPHIDKRSAKRLLTLGTGFATSRIVNFIAVRADLTIVGRFLDATSLGFYSRAYQLMGMPTDLYARTTDRVVFPAMAKVQMEPLRLRAAYARGISLTSLFGLPMTVLLFLLSRDIIAVFLGSRWAMVVPIFSVLAVGSYFRLSARVSASLQRATGSIRQMVSSQVVYAVMTVGGCLLSVRYGVVAVGAAVGTGIVVWFVFITYQSCRLVGVSARTFLGLHKHGAVLAVIVALAVAPLKGVCAILAIPSYGVMIGAALEMAVLAGALMHYNPPMFVGSNGVELIAHLRTAVAKLGKPRSLVVAP